jgi:hypothetical protein
VRIAIARRKLLSALEGLGSVQLSYRPAPDTWSIEDLLHHLALTEEACVKLLARTLRNTQELSPPPDPDPNGFVIDAIDRAVARADGAMAEAPDIVMPKAELAAAEALTRLQASWLALLTSFEALSAFDLSGLTYRHPFFCNFNAYQWVLVTGWHEQRYTRQIDRIKTDPGIPASSN